MSRTNRFLGAAVWDVASLPVFTPALLRGRRGDGHSVVVVPGWRTSDTATIPLRAYLRYLGYDVHGWGFGANRGGREAADAVVGRVRSLAGSTSAPVTVIGWSLGGVVAYDAARRVPSLVDRVITLGSPLSGARALPMPALSIYSRDDQVVSWRSSRLPSGVGRTNVEVRGGHVGLGHNPGVLHTVAEVLARSTSENASGLWSFAYP